MLRGQSLHIEKQNANVMTIFKLANEHLKMFILENVKGNLISYKIHTVEQIKPSLFCRNGFSWF